MVSGVPLKFLSGVVSSSSGQLIQKNVAIISGSIYFSSFNGSLFLDMRLTFFLLLLGKLLPVLAD